MKKKRRYPESDICKALWKWFQLQYPQYADKYLRIEVGGQRTKISQAILKAEGVKAGTSDIFLAIPTKNHAGLWLEVKALKGKMSDNQKKFQAQMTPDYLCRTGWGFEECVEIINQYIELLWRCPE